MKTIMAFVLLAFAIVACNSCVPQPQPVPPPDPPIVVVDAGPLVFDAGPPGPTPGDACSNAEAHAAALGCALAPTIRGASWATACRAYQASGVDMHAACVTEAADCKGVSACLAH